MTGIQALERIAPGLPMVPGKVERREFEYRRNGTQTLIAAFNVTTGEVEGVVGNTRTEKDFVVIGRIGSRMRPIEVVERLGRWSSGRGPLYVLLATRLRRLIDDGELPPGVLLPPDRALAGALAVGRTTVVGAYELLRSEGRITRRQGSGTRVAGTPTTGALEDAPVDPIFLDSLESRDDDVLLADLCRSRRSAAATGRGVRADRAGAQPDLG